MKRTRASTTLSCRMTSRILSGIAYVDEKANLRLKLGNNANILSSPLARLLLLAY